MNNNLAPIVLFTYNRLWHTKQTVEALQKNELASKSELFIYSDGWKNEEDKLEVLEVRKYLKTIDGVKSIHIVEQSKNMGLADSIISGVTKIVNEYGKIIVLEDDMVTSKYFLEYMNDNLNLYKNKHQVASIHGYIYPVKEKLPDFFFLKGADCWGWATWKDRWKIFEEDGSELLKELKNKQLEYEFDFYGSYPYCKMLKEQIKGNNNSWAIRWYASSFLNNMLTLYPGTSYVNNIGNDNSGTHCGANNQYSVHLSSDKYNYVNLNCSENLKAKKIISNFFKGLL